MMLKYAEINILNITVEHLDITIEHIWWLSYSWTSIFLRMPLDYVNLQLGFVNPQCDMKIVGNGNFFKYDVRNLQRSVRFLAISIYTQQKFVHCYMLNEMFLWFKKISWLFSFFELKK